MAATGTRSRAAQPASTGRKVKSGAASTITETTVQGAPKRGRPRKATAATTVNAMAKADAKAKAPASKGQPKGLKTPTQGTPAKTAKAGAKRGK